MKSVKTLFLLSSILLFTANKLNGYRYDLRVSKNMAPAEITQEYLNNLGGKPFPIKLGPVCLNVITHFESICIETDHGSRIFVPSCDAEWQEVKVEENKGLVAFIDKKIADLYKKKFITENQKK